MAKFEMTASKRPMSDHVHHGRKRLLYDEILEMALFAGAKPGRPVTKLRTHKAQRRRGPDRCLISVRIQPGRELKLLTGK